MGRLQEFMDKSELAEEDPTPDLLAQEMLLEQQKKTDLQRAMARSVIRPLKKELRHSQMEGRYIRPKEIKKEIEKLEQAKRQAEEKKKGFFGRFFGKKKKEETAEKEPENTTSKTAGLSDAEKKKKVEHIRQLRGIALAKKIREQKEAEARYLEVNGLSETKQEYGFIPEETEIPVEHITRTPFVESVQRLSDESNPDWQDNPPQEELVDETTMARLQFMPVPTDGPDGIIATALSVAVGFIYFEEDGQKVDRIITIRKLFFRQGDILIDAFCHDIAAPRLIAFSSGIKMYNLQSMKAYENPREFLLCRIAGLNETNNLGDSSFAAVLSVVRYELAALVFVAKSDFNRTDEENDLILAYISQRCPTIDFDENEMLDYIAMLVPDEQSFSEALGIVVKQPQDVVLSFVRTFLQMMLSDGVLHENERELLAELLYLLQTEGIELDRIGLK
ncbi:MAG: TerB family tellurite resistance protein [Alphaproteobacteria bacterium]|nr:TerB family tellurite resistance protein [Alphaproteobacteria bacterium]MBO4643936.1 TerB family tellurite resistance protein [Alphaproteobacteria bacterium]